MSRIRVKINPAGARALLTSGAVQADLLKRAQAIANAAKADRGRDYVASVVPGARRARASVITGDAAAIRSNAKNNTLLKSLDRGRL